VHVPAELHTKGGPCHFEAVFVGYKENHIGWHVRDLAGKYHFSYDVISNESPWSPWRFLSSYFIGYTPWI
jgi:hypothetical protein